jgi:hypothetical protein
MLFKSSFIVTILLCCSIGLHSQTKGKWSDWRQLLDDGTISVQVQFYYPPVNSCQAGGREYKYKYRVKGSYYSSLRYINWKLDLLDCDGQVYYRTHNLQIGGQLGEDITSWRSLESMDYRFPGEDIVQEFYDVSVSTSEKLGSGRKPVVESKLPTQIVGIDKIFLGQSTKLSILDGKLGTQAEWYWYEDKCGGKLIGKGEVINYSPTKTTRVYLQAVGPGQKASKCINKLIEVTEDNYPPDKIDGPDNICLGSTIELKVNGGNIKSGASWVWYKDKCGATKIGTGEKILITPTANTVYFVRAEDRKSFSECVSHNVTVSDVPTPANAIIPSKKEICPGETIELAVKGGRLTGNAEWNWYSNSCNGYFLGTGSTIKVSPLFSTEYYVRAEGGCKASECTKVSINVKKEVSESFVVEAEKIGSSGRKFELKINTPSKSSDPVTWYWHSNDCTKKSMIGNGESIFVKPSNQTVYYVKGVNECGETSCKSITINPTGSDRLSKFMKSNTPHFHYGFGIGLVDWLSFEKDLIGTFLNGTVNKKVSIEGLGIPFEILTYPIINDYFTLGFHVGSTYGTSANRIYQIFESSTSQPRVEYELDYSRFYFGGELAIGTRSMKAIGKISREYQKLTFKKTDFNYSGPTLTFSYSDERETESYGIGIRFGSYVKGNKSNGNCLDIVYNLHNPVGQNYFDFSFGDRSGSRQGIELSWWNTSKFKFRLNVVGQKPGSLFSNGQLLNPYYNLSFLLYWGRFYNYR